MKQFARGLPLYNIACCMRAVCCSACTHGAACGVRLASRDTAAAQQGPLASRARSFLCLFHASQESANFSTAIFPAAGGNAVARLFCCPASAAKPCCRWQRLLPFSVLRFLLSSNSLRIADSFTSSGELCLQHVAGGNAFPAEALYAQRAMVEQFLGLSISVQPTKRNSYIYIYFFFVYPSANAAVVLVANAVRS